VGHPRSGCPFADNNATNVAPELEYISLYLSDEPGDDSSPAVENEPTRVADVPESENKKVTLPTSFAMIWG
jgi:hypothetical protein